jgi:RNA-directed DNA polymerase
LDHFVKEQLKATQYLRYVDDFALFSDDREFLIEARRAIEEYLTTLRLKIHPIKSQLFETKQGATFVGFRVLPIGKTFPKEIRIRIRSENLKRGRRRLKRYQKQYAIGQITFERLSQSLQSWAAHLKHADTWHLRQQIFTPLSFSAPSAPLR